MLEPSDGDATASSLPVIDPSQAELVATAQFLKEWGITKPISWLPNDLKLPSASATPTPNSILPLPPVSIIPRFYNKPSAASTEPNSLRQQIRNDARSQFLQKMSKQLLDTEELNDLLDIFEKYSSVNVTGRGENKSMIGYEQFIKALDDVPDKVRQLFQPETEVFVRISQKQTDLYGRAQVNSLLSFAMRRNWLLRSRLGLSLYDVTGDGHLTERDLELYIKELIPTLPQLTKLDVSVPTCVPFMAIFYMEQLHCFYTFTAVRRFMFFLDSKRQGRVRITDVLASGFLDELLELREQVQEGEGDVSQASARTNTQAAVQNWFSADNLLRVYGQYLNLDTDRNGMLSKDELREYDKGKLTDVFLDRLFQECVTYKKSDEPYENEMDYKSYLDFVLAMENKKDRASLEYFMRILDVRGKGYLDGFDMHYFFRPIAILLEETAQCDEDLVDFLDLRDELFDMVAPREKDKIRLSDLLACRQGHTLVSLLIDHEGFWAYEHREMLAQDDDDD